MEIAVAIITSLLGALGFVGIALLRQYVKTRKAQEAARDERDQRFRDSIEDKFETIDSFKTMAMEELGMLTRINSQQAQLLTQYGVQIEQHGQAIEKLEQKTQKNGDAISKAWTEISKKADK